MKKKTIIIRPYLYVVSIYSADVPCLILAVHVEGKHRVRTFRSTIEMRRYIFDKFLQKELDVDWEIKTEDIIVEEEFHKFTQIHE